MDKTSKELRLNLSSYTTKCELLKSLDLTVKD